MRGRKQRKPIGKLLYVAGIILLLASCRLVISDAGPLEVAVTGSRFTLAWEEAKGPGVPDSPSGLRHYEVFYRPLGTLDWRLLGQTAGQQPVYTVAWPSLTYGEYEFAVRSVSQDGVVSEMHGSRDFDAWPPGGWYLNWKP